MGQIRKINDVYYIEFYARGLLYSQVAGPYFEEAQKLLEQVEKKIAGGEALTIARHIDLPDFFERFIEETKIQQYSTKSIERFKHTIEHFTDFIDADFSKIQQLAQITPVIVESYKVYLVKTQKPKIVNFTILLMRDIFEFGIKLGFLTDNPSLHVRLLPWPRMQERKQTARYDLAKHILSKGIGISKSAQLLKIKDIAKTIYYANLIPQNREDVYN